MWAIVFRHSVACGAIVRIVPTWAIFFRHSVACGVIVRIVPTSDDVGYPLSPLRGLRRDRAIVPTSGDVGYRLSPLRGLRRDLCASFPHLAMWAIVFRHSVACGAIVR